MIKLKQVEHVRNERKALAAVIDHPFITTLIASFSDEKCLYMLVWQHFFFSLWNLEYILDDHEVLTIVSWIIALEVKYSHISDGNDALAKRSRRSMPPK